MTPIAEPTVDEVECNIEGVTVNFTYYADAEGNQPIAAPVNAGTYYVKASVEAGTNYTAATSALKGFTIAPRDINEAAAAVSNQTYSGEALTPAVSVVDFDGASPLVDTADFTVEYSDNTNAGTAKATVIGKGNYTGSKTVEFEIAPLDITATMNVVVAGGSTYTGTEQKPAVTVTVGETALVEDRDYELTYSNNINAGTAAVAVACKGNYAGGTEKDFGIAKATLTVKANDQTVGYGTELGAKSVTISGFVNNENESVLGGALTFVTDYNTTSPVNGNYTVTPEGYTSGNYEITFKSGVITVTRKALTDTDITVADIADEVYNGAEHAPTVVVKNGATLLVVDEDYTAVYTNNVNAGSATVTITGKGNYDGVITKNFKINPIVAELVWADYSGLTYNGQAKNVVAAVTNKIAGDEVLVAVTGGKETDAGSYTATAAGLTGAQAANYKLADPAPQQPYSIEKASLTLGAVTVADKSYNGEVDDADITAVAFAGLQNGETLTLGSDFTLSNVVYTSPNANESVEVTGTVTLADTDKANNYELANGTFSTTGKISKAVTTLAISAADDIYAGSNYDESKISKTGNVNETVTYTYWSDEDCTVSATPKNAGTYYVKGVIEESDNYSAAEAVASFRITKAALSVTAKDHAITYGDAPANSGVDYAGFVNGETASVLGGELAYDYDYAQYGNVGTYAIAPKGLTSGNYDIAFLTGELTVEKKAVALIWTGTGTQYYNGEEKTVTAAVADGYLVNGDEIAVTVTGGKQTNAGTYVAVATALTGSKAGNYKLPAEVSADFEIVDIRSASVTFNFHDGTTQTVEYAAEDLMTRLPVDSRPGYRFSGWRFKSNGVAAVSGVYTQMLDALLTALDAADDPLTAEPQFFKSSSGSSTRNYTVTATAGEGGSVSPKGGVSVAKGESVTFAFAPETGYRVKSVKVDGKTVDAASGYTFENVSSNHTIEVTFEKVERVNPFTDVDPGKYYYDAVLWAVAKGITRGTTDTTFEPAAICNRGQMVTFLWRAAGEPEPKTTVNPFADVREDAYYYKAVLWAVENGITNGLTATFFGPAQACTRGQMATFLWRAGGKQAPTGTTSAFTDVASGKYYYDAVLWAAERGITLGKTATTFVPAEACNRGQMVTFLYRNELAK